MSIQKPHEAAFREALEARGFWRDAVLNDPELGFAMLDGSGLILSANDNAADILRGLTADVLIGRRLHDVLSPAIADERLEFLKYILTTGRSLLVTSIFRGVRCRCMFRRLPGDAGDAGHILWTLRRAPIPWQPADLHAMIDVVEAQAADWGPLSALTEEERMVFAVIGAGVAPMEAALRLEIPLDAVLQLQTAIAAKLRTHSPVQIAQYAMTAGFVEPSAVLLDQT